uniref:RRM domain-containing protein n=1 Tax=Meloidogyne floridensis TaxID=298350 RepID=A0A915NN50_9BILA
MRPLTSLTMREQYLKRALKPLKSTIIDRNTQRSKGFGFCEFQDQQGAENAVQKMNGVEMNGRPLRVNWANSK